MGRFVRDLRDGLLLSLCRAHQAPTRWRFVLTVPADLHQPHPLQLAIQLLLLLLRPFDCIPVVVLHLAEPTVLCLLCWSGLDRRIWHHARTRERPISRARGRLLDAILSSRGHGPRRLVCRHNRQLQGPNEGVRGAGDGSQKGNIPSPTTYQRRCNQIPILSADPTELRVSHASDESYSNRTVPCARGSRSTCTRSGPPQIQRLDYTGA